MQEKILNEIQCIIIENLNTKILKAIEELYERYKELNPWKSYFTEDPFKEFKNNLFEDVRGDENTKLCKLLDNIQVESQKILKFKSIVELNKDTETNNRYRLFLLVAQKTHYLLTYLNKIGLLNLNETVKQKVQEFCELNLQDKITYSNKLLLPFSSLNTDIFNTIISIFSTKKMLAICKEAPNINCIKLLINMGANINVVDKIDQFNGLHWLLAQEHTDLNNVKFFLDKHIAINPEVTNPYFNGDYYLSRWSPKIDKSYLSINPKKNLSNLWLMNLFIDAGIKTDKIYFNDSNENRTKSKEVFNFTDICKQIGDYDAQKLFIFLILKNVNPSHLKSCEKIQGKKNSIFLYEKYCSLQLLWGEIKDKNEQERLVVLSHINESLANSINCSSLKNNIKISRLSGCHII